MVAKNEHANRSGCPIACALDIFGDHWALLVIRDLAFFDRHEYKDFLHSEESISSNILSDRLKKLEAYSIISSLPHPDSQRRKLYYLTNKGKDLIPVLVSISRWSEQDLGKVVKIPPASRKMLVNNPDALVQETLKQIEQWEKSVGL
ncbi:MAG: helix-turn-helix transcriptional regulator [Gammaproteobacteria bacterium]|nr:helix-turn-helix transcriptional regulator [Gammaproteobacteria bacterium]